jgi:hypothetical protein
MSNPTFDSVALTSAAAVERVGSPRARTYREDVPDVRGEFLQVAPPGGRDIDVAGLYAGAACTLPGDAHAALKAALLNLQSKVCTGLATYVGTDGRAYPDCLLLAHGQVGPVEVVPAPGAQFQAACRVKATVRHTAT